MFLTNNEFNEQQMNKKRNRMERYRNCTFLLLAFLLLFSSWIEKKPVLKNGIYRTVLMRPDGKEIVFNFQAKDSAGRKILYVLNAEERLLVDNVTVKEDSVFIQLPFFDSEFKALINNDGKLSGQWVKKFGDREQVLPFEATYN